MNSNNNKKSQVSLFFIIAIVIVAAAAFVIVSSVKPAVLPIEIQEVEDSFISCVGNLVDEGAFILGEQGGYIALPEIEEGSAYMPFRSQLNFFGVDIPYWFYVSGNGLHKEQKPSISSMEKALSDHISGNIDECLFGTFTEQGYEISTGEEAKVQTTISGNSISTEIDYPITITFGEVTRRVSKHSTKINSEIGSLYAIAKKIFETEQQELFLEKYTFDVITLNAPTTGAEISCSPKIWLKNEIQNEVQAALQNNIPALKIKGSYYTLTDNKNEYFVTDIGEEISNKVNILYSPLFPISFDIQPSDDEIMKALPIGTQSGLGILGFCYVPYHFVYSIAHPVLIQIYSSDNEKFFQFPIVVVIDKNKPRESVALSTPEIVENELCKQKTQEISVYTYNPENEPVEANVKYKCLNTVCDIGETRLNEYGEAELSEEFPQCINGFLITSSEGYITSKQQFSTNEQGVVDLMLKPLHKLNVEVFKGFEPIENDETLLINFRSEEHSTSIVYPSQKQIELGEEVYNIEAHLFKMGNINLPGGSTEKCIKVPASGIAGFFGVETEECYDIEMSEQTLTQVIIGGGKDEWSFTNAELSSSSNIEIGVSEFVVPEDISSVQDNYNLIEITGIDIYLK